MTHSAIAPRAPRMNFHALLPGQRVCQKCKRYTTAKGGKYQKTDRLHQRWICAACLAKDKVPPMHPMFAQMLGYAPAIISKPPKFCTRKHILEDEAFDARMTEATLQAVLAAMHGEMSIKELTEKSGLYHKTVQRSIRQLQEDGRVRFVKHSKYFGRVFAKAGEDA